MTLENQIQNLFLLALPIASIAWTVTHEEVFREPRDYCVEKSNSGKSIVARKIFYLFTCEYCFSHYITVAFLIITKYHLIFEDWRGYLIAGFSLVWIANIYMGIFGLVRVGLKKENFVANIKEVELKEVQAEKNITDETK